MIDIVTNESVTALAQTLGNKRGWKQQMPASPPGLPAGGAWTQQTVGDVVRLRYQVAKGQPAQIIGEWRAADAAPHVNGTGPKPAPPATRDPEPVAIDEPQPIIVLTPAPGGALRLNAYGLDSPAIIRALRLSLLHLVARSAGALIIDEVIAPEMAIVAQHAPALRPVSNRKRKPANAPHSNVRTTVRYPDRDEEDDPWS